MKLSREQVQMAKGSSQKRRRSGEDELASLETDGPTIDDGWGDECGWRYITLLQQHTSDSIKPNV